MSEKKTRKTPARSRGQMTLASGNIERAMKRDFVVTSILIAAGVLSAIATRYSAQPYLLLAVPLIGAALGVVICEVYIAGIRLASWSEDNTKNPIMQIKEMMKEPWIWRTKVFVVSGICWFFLTAGSVMVSMSLFSG